jgi:hypothetical protein
MLQRSEVNEKVRYLSTDELSEIISQCENAIAKGTAEIDDYEAFVLCQQELARRTWSQA